MASTKTQQVVAEAIAILKTTYFTYTLIILLFTHFGLSFSAFNCRSVCGTLVSTVTLLVQRIIFIFSSRFTYTRTSLCITFSSSLYSTCYIDSNIANLSDRLSKRTYV